MSITLADITKTLYAQATTAQLELLHDFQELPEAQQMSLLFLGLLGTAADTEWCKRTVIRLTGGRG